MANKNGQRKIRGNLLGLHVKGKIWMKAIADVAEIQVNDTRLKDMIKQDRPNTLGLQYGRSEVARTRQPKQNSYNRSTI